MSGEVVRDGLYGLAATAVLGAIVLGSCNLAHFDAALVAYTFSRDFFIGQLERPANVARPLSFI